jgi:short-subunit dehydrogenase
MLVFKGVRLLLLSPLALVVWAWGLLGFGWLASLVLGALGIAVCAAIIEWHSYTYGALPNPDGKDTCVITGGTHGIGGELAKLFARDGFNLIIVARYENELQQKRQELLAINRHILVITIPKNLYSGDGADELFTYISQHSAVRARGLRINHLINNVGMCIRGDFLELPLIDMLGMMHLNMVNCVKLSYMFGNRFKQEIDAHRSAKDKYRILNVASFASLIPCPFLSVYSGTKAFVHSFSVSFNEELKAGKYRDRITCTSLCPGYTSAPSLRPAGIPNCVAYVLGNRDTSDRVARAGYRALMEGIFFVLVGFMNILLYWLTTSVLPTKTTAKIGKFFNSDWENLTWDNIKKEGLSVSHGWSGDSVAARDLRAGLSAS